MITTPGHEYNLERTLDLDRYQQTIDKLFELQKFGIKLGLNSTRNLLDRLGDPHLNLRVVHIAGTNGKGSVGAMIESALLVAGMPAGMYTSPHLVDFSERFRIKGWDISREKVMDLADEVWSVTDPREPPTFFEFVTAMAFLYFAREEADPVVLETGLGGRLDATNVCNPLVTVITNLGLEHQEYLGKRLRDIAFEKAGIIKPQVPLVHGVRQPPARRVLEEKAASLGSPVIRRGREISYRRLKDGRFNLKGGKWRLDGIATNLLGRHQPENACLAMGVLETLAAAGVPVGSEHLEQGLSQVHWPGRLEKWPTGEGEPTLWLDGAHNVPAAKNLIENLELIVEDRSPLVMVVGIMGDKNYPAMLREIIPPADKVVFSRPVYARAAEPELLARAAPHGPPSEVVEDLGQAVERAKELAGPKGVVLVTGSLFTVGEARGRLAGTFDPHGQGLA